MSVNNPRGLLRAVFYYNGKNFCLRGGEEHRGLKLSQLKRTKTGYTYTENASKNRAGGIAQLRLENKVVDIVASDEATDRCHCRLLDQYISKLPEKAKSQDLFYVRPIDTSTGELRTGSGKWCDHTLTSVITLLGLHPVERAPLTNVWNAIL